MKNLFYKIAGHIFRLSFSEAVCFTSSLDNYAPFRIADSIDEYLFHLSVTESLVTEEDYELIGQFDDDIASIGVFRSTGGNFCFHIAYPNSKDYCAMVTDVSFSVAQVKLPDSLQLGVFYFNNCLMLLYAFSTANLDTLLMHASVIKNGGERDLSFLEKVARVKVLIVACGWSISKAASC